MRLASVAEWHNSHAWGEQRLRFSAAIRRAAFENGYDEQTANIKGRTWYVALKKRF